MVEQTVTKAVKQALPEMVKKQVEDTVAPLLVKQQELMEAQLRQSLVPKIEQHILKLQQKQTADSQPQIVDEDASKAQAKSGITKDQVKKLIQTEFREVMTNEIVPKMEVEIQSMVDQIHENMDSVNKVLYEKLVQEEIRSDAMI